MSWAAEAGLVVPPIRLEPTAAIAGIQQLANVAGEFAFVIQRYDRALGGRVHQEDFAQVLGLGTGSAKYNETNIDTILNVCATLAPEDVDELLARIAFCVVSGNDDAHAKNWSFWYPRPSQPRLSPAYDLVATLVFPQYARNTMALKLAGVRQFEDVTLARFRMLASRTGLDAERVEAVVRRAVIGQVEAWARVRDKAEMPAELQAFVDLRLERLRLVREALAEG